MRRALLVSVVVSVWGAACSELRPRGGPTAFVATEGSARVDVSSATPPACGERVDEDGDGFTRLSTQACTGDAGAAVTFASTDDCDDADATRHVGRAYWLDRDGDGYGTTAAVVWSCEGDIPSGTADNTSDCDDTDPSVRIRRYPDADGDGFGALEGARCVAGDIPGYVAQGYDCDDTDAERYPSRPEVNYDGFDSDCDGLDVQFGLGDGTDPPALDGAPWCDGPALAVVALHPVLSFIREVEIANVGTRSVSGAQANVTSFDPSFTTPGSVQTFDVSALEPGQSQRVGRFTGGAFSVELLYPGASVADAGEVDAATGTDVAQAGTRETATAPAFDEERCKRALAPFQFTAPYHLSARSVVDRMR